MKSKQNVPQVRFKGFTDAWEQRELRSVFTIRNEKNGDRYSREDVLAVSDTYGCVNQIKFHGRSFAGEDISNYKVVRTGDIVYTKSPLQAKPYGIIKIVGEETGIVSPLYVVNETVEGIDSSFMYYLFDTPERTNNYLSPLVRKGAKNTMNISNEEWLSGIVTISSNEQEQQQIGAYFRNLDHLITLHQRKCETLQKLKKSMLQKMFPKNGSLYPEIRFAGFTDAWEQREFGEVFVEYSEKNHEELPPLTIIQGKGTILREESDRNLIYDKSGLKNYKLVHEGDFILHLRSFEGGLEVANSRGIVSPAYHIFYGENVDSRFYYPFFRSKYFISVLLKPHVYGIRDGKSIDVEGMKSINIPCPTMEEQQAIGDYFTQLDKVITLHQRKPFRQQKEVKKMLNDVKRTDLFCDYYAKWVKVYKDGAIRKVTLDKYNMTISWLKKLVPNLELGSLNRIAYQQLLNDYALYHERQTTMDFHHQLKGAILDAVDEGLIDRDPTRKAIIKGKPPTVKKIKYLNQFEVHTLLSSLDLKSGVNWDWFILLVAKTGMRFSEALALTPKDFDFAHQMLSICKTWDYKGEGGFLPTKNKSSVRKIQIDWQTVIQFSELVKGLPEDEPIFVKGKVYNSTVNDILSRHCKALNLSEISIHGLRHTHASLLLFAGVSIASVARRLGHASMTTTQKTYLHIIQELENQDVDLVMRSLSGLS